MASVEVLENGSWRYGPVLPVGIQNTVVFEHPSGNGIIAVGGANLYYLSDAGLTTKWITLSQTKKLQNGEFFAVMIPDNLTNCTLV